MLIGHYPYEEQPAVAALQDEVKFGDVVMWSGTRTDATSVCHYRYVLQVTPAETAPEMQRGHLEGQLFPRRLRRWYGPGQGCCDCLVLSNATGEGLTLKSRPKRLMSDSLHVHPLRHPGLRKSGALEQTGRSVRMLT